MAVQAQYQHQFHDLCSMRPLLETTAAAATTFLESESHLLGGAYAQLANVNAASDPHSELTCTGNAGGVSRERAREYSDVHCMDQLRVPPLFVACGDPQSSQVDSAAASTSGRTDVFPFAHGLAPHLYNQSLEINALVRLHNERLRSELEEARRRHIRAVVAAVERSSWRRMREVEAELLRARGRNVELEEKVRQMSAEGQVWLGIAKNHEAVAADLRAALDNMLANGYAPAGDELGEAADAQSCCFETDQEVAGVWSQSERWLCKACGEKEVCALLLPCRHLCLCGACEAGVDTCPVCAAAKNGSVHVMLS